MFKIPSVHSVSVLRVFSTKTSSQCRTHARGQNTTLNFRKLRMTDIEFMVGH